jgi:uncharacterized protein
MTTPLPVLHARASAFSYRCRACNRCCYNKRIPVNPYEIARLSRKLGCRTTEVITNFTVAGGTALAQRHDTACVFLGPNGCTVHSDRPLACRLYPLGRIVHANGSEAFVQLEPHPETEGLYGKDGTVDAYVESQGVAPYIAAADRYYSVLTRLLATDGTAPPSQSSGDSAPEEINARVFVDADLAVQIDAAQNGDPMPRDVDALVERHLSVIKRLADRLAAPQ